MCWGAKKEVVGERFEGRFDLNIILCEKFSNNKKCKKNSIFIYLKIQCRCREKERKIYNHYLSSTWDESLLLKWEEFFVLKDYLKKKWNVENLVQTHACLHLPPSFLLWVCVSPAWWVSGPCAPGILQTLCL